MKIRGEGPVFIHCCQDGTITIREEGEPVFNGKALPVYRTQDRETAENLRVVACSVRLEEHPLLPGKTWYGVKPFEPPEWEEPGEAEMEYLDAVGRRFARVHEIIREREKGVG